jgi:hypothetical protein
VVKRKIYNLEYLKNFYMETENQSWGSPTCVEDRGMSQSLIKKQNQKIPALGEGRPTTEEKRHNIKKGVMEDKRTHRRHNTEQLMRR